MVCKRCFKKKHLINLCKSLVENTKNGWRGVSEDVYKERMATCDGCEHLKDKKCGLCGCYVPLKGLLAVEKCPDDKWPDGV